MVSAVRPAYALAVDARDARFDGVFFVGITTTHVYCRPICPSRIAYDRHRRFFDSAARARAGGGRLTARAGADASPAPRQALAGRYRPPDDAGGVRERVPEPAS